MGARHTAFDCLHARLQLRDHAAAYAARCQHFARFGNRHLRNERALVREILVKAVNVGKEDDLMRTDGACDGASRRIGVDVVRAAVYTLAHRSDNRHVVCSDKRVDVGRVHFRHTTHAAKLRTALLGDHGAGVGAVHANGKVAVLVHGKNQLFVDLAHQRHLHHVHGFFGGNALAILKFDVNAKLFHVLVDGSTATVHDNGVHAHDLQHNDVAHHGIAQLGVDHCGSAVLDKHGFACGGFDPRESLDKNLGSMCGGYFAVSSVFHER